MSDCVASAVLITGRIKKVRTDLVNIKISWNYYARLTVKRQYAYARGLPRWHEYK